jgi:hypothetical protein
MIVVHTPLFQSSILHGMMEVPDNAKWKLQIMIYVTLRHINYNNVPAAF